MSSCASEVVVVLRRRRQCSADSSGSSTGSSATSLLRRSLADFRRVALTGSGSENRERVSMCLSGGFLALSPPRKDPSAVVKSSTGSNKQDRPTSVLWTRSNVSVKNHARSNVQDPERDPAVSCDPVGVRVTDPRQNRLKGQVSQNQDRLGTLAKDLDRNDGKRSSLVVENNLVQDRLPNDRPDQSVIRRINLASKERDRVGRKKWRHSYTFDGGGPERPASALYCIQEEAELARSSKRDVAFAPSLALSPSYVSYFSMDHLGFLGGTVGY